jgi:hypothetical protein
MTDQEKQLRHVKELREKHLKLYAICEVDQLILSLQNEGKTPREIRLALIEEAQNTITDIQVLQGFKLFGI